MARYKEIIATASFPEYDYRLKKLGPYDATPDKKYKVERRFNRHGDTNFYLDKIFKSASDAFKHFYERCLEQAGTL